MPDFAPNTILWKLVIYMDISGMELQNVFHFRNRDVIPSNALPSYTSGLIDDWNLRMLPNWQALQSFGLKYIKAINTVIVPNFGPVSEFTYLPGTVGSVSGAEPLATFNAMVISKLTGLSGRSNRGRFFIPGVSALSAQLNDLTESTFQQLSITALGLLANWGPTGSDSRNQIVLYSPKLGNVSGHPTLSGIIPITKFTAHQQLFTQRHRLKGIGV